VYPWGSACECACLCGCVRLCEGEFVLRVLGLCVHWDLRVGVCTLCVCACVCVREREREGEREGDFVCESA